MCELCDAESVDEGSAFDLDAFLGLLITPVVDYFAEYHTESEADLTGELPEGGTWKASVAKVGGGTVGKTYPAGESWITQGYENDELVWSSVAAPPYGVTHEQVLMEVAEYLFNHQG